jgi:1,4-dihydroxy-2-naphthoate polyprenyltransferase
VNVWVEAARPRTLPASLTPVIVGTAAAERFVAWRAVCALIVSLSLQIAVNYANDLFDARSGVDTHERVGPRRAVAAGLVTSRTMSFAVAAALGVAALSGVALAAAAGWELLVVGLAALVATLAYSGGRRPYASAGLGEVMVFLFFGVVATAGSAYVQDETLRSVPVLASVPMGALAAAILIANNLRDIDTDAAAGKRTVAVRLGRARTVVLYRSAVALAFASLAPIAFVSDSAWPLLAGAAAVAAAPAWRAVRSDSQPPMLIAALGATARLQLVFGCLLAAGLWISS